MSGYESINELGFIPMQLHVRGFDTNQCCHCDAQAFLLSSPLDHVHTGERREAVWKMLIYTKMCLVAAVEAQQAKVQATCVSCKTHFISIFKTY